MSLLTRASDLVYTFRFLKLLTTPWEKTNAYKHGIIDGKGKRDKSVKLDSSEKKAAYTPFHRIVYNVKRLVSKVPGGGSRLASYASALYLIKEHYKLKPKQLNNILEKCHVEQSDLLAEDSKWYLLENQQLSPGVYHILNDKVLSETWDDVVYSKDKIRIKDDSFPTGEIFGLPIYEATHIATNRTIHITPGEISK